MTTSSLKNFRFIVDPIVNALHTEKNRADYQWHDPQSASYNGPNYRQTITDIQARLKKYFEIDLFTRFNLFKLTLIKRTHLTTTH